MKEECIICKKNVTSQSIKQCCKCNIRICDDCSYYSRFYRKIREAGLPDIEIDEETYYCKIHFIEFLNGLSEGFLQEMLNKNFLIDDKYHENKQEINYRREFKGKDLSKLVFGAIPEWPSDEWKDWNTM